MSDFNTIAPNYYRAKERWRYAPMLSTHYEAILACYAGNGHGLVGYIKSFIECVCVTVLADFNKKLPSNNPTSTELFSTALASLGLQNSRTASKLNKILSSFNKLFETLSEMRNDHDPIVHGKDAFLDALTTNSTRAFLHAGDALLSIVLNALEGKEPDLASTRDPYENFSHYTDKMDRLIQMDATVEFYEERQMLVVSIMPENEGDTRILRIEPSKLLYSLDRPTFVDIWKSSVAMPADADTEDREGVKTAKMIPGTSMSSQPDVLLQYAPATEFMPEYEGKLAVLRPGLKGFLRGEGLPTSLTPEGEAALLNSLLTNSDQSMGEDWRERSTLLARLKVVCRRVLTRFGYGERAEGVAERFVTWLRIQAPEEQ